MPRDSDRSFAALNRLLLQTAFPETAFLKFEKWRATAVGIIESALGADHPIATKLEAVENTRATVHSLGEPFPGVARAEGLIEAAMREIAARAQQDAPWSPATVDPGLWARVEKMVNSDDWENVASSAVIFTEDWIRNRAGNPPSRTGGRLVGEGLYAEVLGSNSALRLGEEGGEWQGWMKLGMGLAQAVGNVDRHRLQDRDDVRTYAMGVVGLCSLLITQLKYQHTETTEEV